MENIDGQLNLKKAHCYYTQIQDRLYCNLIIYTFCGMKIIYKGRYESFITDMCNSLGSFYGNYFEKAILNKFLYKYYENLDVKNDSKIMVL